MRKHFSTRIIRRPFSTAHSFDIAAVMEKVRKKAAARKLTELNVTTPDKTATDITHGVNGSHQSLNQESQNSDIISKAHSIDFVALMEKVRNKASARKVTELNVSTSDKTATDTTHGVTGSHQSLNQESPKSEITIDHESFDEKYPVITYLDGSKYAGEMKDFMKHGLGRFIYPTGEILEGEFREGNIYNGRGVEITPAGTYEGTWKDGTMTGVVVSKNDDVLRGEFVRGNLNGFGEHWDADGLLVYQGQYLEGKRHGQGMRQYTDGAKYVGDFVDGLKHGLGVHTNPDGSCYKGEYQANQKSGIGVYVQTNGNKYSGEWLENRKHGVGIETTSDGQTLQGEFREGTIYNGHGVLKYVNIEQVYEGTWKEGKLTGPGKLTLPHGVIYEGEFANGVLNGFGRYFKSEGKLIYEGTFVDGLRQGQGTQYFLDGSVYTGEFLDDQMTGMAKITYSDGRSLEGEFKENRIYNGGGTYIFNNGLTFEGTYVNGILEGKVKSISDTSVFVGEYRNGLREGYGEEESIPPGYSYKGQYQNGMRHGDGELITPYTGYKGMFFENMRHGAGKVLASDGSTQWEGTYHMDQVYCGSGSLELHFTNGDTLTYEGTWENGGLEGPGRAIGMNGSLFEGFYQRGELNGYGRYVGPLCSKYDSVPAEKRPKHGTIYEGFFVDGKRHGLGKVTGTDGTVFEGEFFEDRVYNGRGIFMDDTGKYEGVWEDGEFNGIYYGKPIIDVD